MPKKKEVTTKKRVTHKKKVLVEKPVIDPRCRKCRKLIQGGFLTVADGRACSPGCAN